MVGQIKTMKSHWKHSGAIICAAACIGLLACQTGNRMIETRLKYPETRRVSQVDEYHGVKVSDPYRWLEDDNAPETKSWVESQNQVTFSYLEKIPKRQEIKSRLTELWNYERFGLPSKLGSHYFYSRNDGLQNQNVLFWTEKLEDPGQVLLDPNKLTKDGTVALSGTAITEDGKWMAYGLSTAGSDWQEWFVREVATGRDLPDKIQWVKFSGASWTKDNKGFFYSRYDEPTEEQKLQKVNYYQKLFYHRIGSPQSADELVYERKDQKEWGFHGGVSEDGRYLIISVSQGTDPKNLLFYQDLSQPGSKVVELVGRFEASMDFVGNEGGRFWIQTDLNAPRGRLVEIDISRPEKKDWKELIPQSANKLQGVSLVNDQFICSYLQDAKSLVERRKLDGSLMDQIKLPGIGSAGGFGGLRTDKETFYSFVSYTRPTTLYHLDLETGKSTIYKSPNVSFDPEQFSTEQVFYRSKDGTRIPMFISYRKGLKLNGDNPLYLYGYGGFNISLTPGFSPAILAWMEMGGVYAVPNLRGGGEYGEEWHQAGTKLSKQKVFDDFISAAEWLVAKQFTNPKKLAIGGGSNGGLLVGACMVQRPDLFRAALPAVGVLDMLRFEKFTIGWAWTSDYGSAKNPEEFAALYKYSPYHNLRGGVSYPATLITTADHDDRVVPAHSFKFAAALQKAHAGKNPVLIRIETKAGHGAGKPTAKVIEEAADKWAFLFRELSMREAYHERATEPLQRN